MRPIGHSTHRFSRAVPWWTAVAVAAFATPGVRAEGPAPAGFHITLTNGAVFHGTLAVSEFKITVDGQVHSIPREQVKRFTPGLNRRPELLKTVRRLVRDLAARAYHQRAAASAKLAELGPEIRGELERFRQDDDLERRVRVKRLLRLSDRYKPEGFALRQDCIETAKDSFLGTVAVETLEVSTEYGRLRIPPSRVAHLRDAEQLARVDLLKEIDLKQAAIRGKWKRVNGALVSPQGVPWALLQLAAKPPASYTIRAIVERKGGSDALVFPIVVGEHECNVCLDGWPRAPNAMPASK